MMTPPSDQTNVKGGDPKLDEQWKTAVLPLITVLVGDGLNIATGRAVGVIFEGVVRVVGANVTERYNALKAL